MTRSTGTRRTPQFSGVEVLWFLTVAGAIHYIAGYLHGWVAGASWWF